MEVVVALVVVQQTQPFHQHVWPSVPIVKTIERPLIQWNMLVITTQPIVVDVLTCAYCQ
jgi:hypothetical protein